MRLCSLKFQQSTWVVQLVGFVGHYQLKMVYCGTISLETQAYVKFKRNTSATELHRETGASQVQNQRKTLDQNLGRELEDVLRNLRLRMKDCFLFLLLCPSFEVQLRNLLAGVFVLFRPFGYIDLSNEVLTQLLLCGDKGLPNDVNRNILKLTLLYIHTTGRLN